MSIFNFLQGVERETKKKVDQAGSGIFNFLKNAKAPEAITSNPVYKGLQSFSENVAAPVLTGATRAAVDVPSNIATTIGKVATLGIQNQALDKRNQETHQGIQDFLSNIGVQKKNNSLAQQAGRGAIGLAELVGQLPVGGGAGDYAAGLAKAGIGVKSLTALKTLGEANPAFARNLVTTILNPATDNLAVKGARIAGEGLGFGAAQNAIEGKGAGDIAKSTAINTAGGALLHDVGTISRPAALKIKSGIQTFIKNGQAEGVSAEVLQRAKDAWNNSPLGNEHGYIGGSKATGFPEAQKAGAVSPGVDTHPKFEVDDSQAKLTPENAKRGQGTLPEILDHPYLYKDYPQLQGVNVRFTDTLDPKQNGLLDRNTNTIVINKNLSRAKQQETLLHEAQHAVQTIEGFAGGGSPAGMRDIAASANGKPFDIYRALAGEVEARNVANRRNLTIEDRQRIPFNKTFDIKPQDQIVHYDNGVQTSQEATGGPQGALDALSAPANRTMAEVPQKAPTQPVESPGATPATEKLIAALKAAKPAQAEIAKAQSQVLGARSAAGGKILESGQGEDAFKQAKRALQGPLVEQPPTIKSELSQPELTSLFNQIKDHSQLRFFEKIRAYDALNKVFEGTVPQKNEIGLLEDVFGSKFAKEIVDINKTTGQKIREGILSVANIPRAIMSSFDFSAPFRQGLVLTVNHPVSAIKAGGQMFKAAFSPKVYNGWLEELKAGDSFNRIKDSGLYIADARHVAGTLNDKEEAFMSNIAEKIPVLGRVIKASERAYNTYLNKIRVDTFNSMADRYTASGQGDEENLKSLAKFINTATGRGNLGRLEKIAPELNTVLFAPRNMASRLNMLNPAWYVGLKGPAKKEAIKSAGIVLATGLTTLAIAKAAGAEVNDDPRSTDFGKIKVGDTRYDIWGGFQQYARVATQLLSGQKNVQGDVSKADRLDTATKFVRSKLAPIPASTVDIAEGTDYVGQPVTVGSLAQKNLLPFGVQDTLGTDLSTTASALPSVFGVGFQNYSSNQTGARSSGSGGRGSGSGGTRGGTSHGRGK
jgi:hypothetical protein